MIAEILSIYLGVWERGRSNNYRFRFTDSFSILSHFAQSAVRRSTSISRIAFRTRYFRLSSLLNLTSTRKELLLKNSYLPSHQLCLLSVNFNSSKMIVRLYWVMIQCVIDRVVYRRSALIHIGLQKSRIDRKWGEEKTRKTWITDSATEQLGNNNIDRVRI
jgi:hypothetical protein